jgi:hypothetical protein
MHELGEKCKRFDLLIVYPLLRMGKGGRKRRETEAERLR